MNFVVSTMEQGQTVLCHKSGVGHSTQPESTIQCAAFAASGNVGAALKMAPLPSHCMYRSSDYLPCRRAS
jgi:hypothetical protein